MPPDLPTRLDYYALGRNYVVQRAKKIDPAVVDTEGSDANIVVGTSAVLADAVTKQLAYQTNRLFLDGCFEDDLDRYAFDRYSLLRKGASPAVGSVTFGRPAATVGAGSVPIGTRLLTPTGVEYTTTEVATFGASDLVAAAPCNVRAAQAGKATQASAGQITRFQQPQLLFDRTLTVTNEKSTAGGEDVEDDDTFKARIRNFWSTARRGVIGAIEFGALTVPGVVSARAQEVLTPGLNPARVVNLYIADSSGVASQALADQVASVLTDYRAAGIAVLISTSIPLLVQVQVSLAFVAGVDTRSLTTLALAAIVTFVNTLPVNGPLLVADLGTVLNRFKPDGLIATQGSILLPAGDLYPPIGQTLRTTPALVTSVS
jgi:uncharacterized phage protein gp47/JayE